MHFISLRKARDTWAERGIDEFISALKREATDSISKLNSLLVHRTLPIQVMLTSHEFLYGNLQGGEDCGGYASEEDKNKFELEMQALVEQLTAEYRMDICLAPGTISFATKSDDSHELNLYTRAYLFIANQPIQFKDKTIEGPYKILHWGEKEIFVSICADFCPSARYVCQWLSSAPDIYYVPSHGLISVIELAKNELKVKTGTIFISDDGMFSRDVKIYEVTEPLSAPAIISLTKKNRHRFVDAVSLKNDFSLSIFCVASKAVKYDRTSSVFYNQELCVGSSIESSSWDTMRKKEDPKMLEEEATGHGLY